MNRVFTHPAARIEMRRSGTRSSLRGLAIGLSAAAVVFGAAEPAIASPVARTGQFRGAAVAASRWFGSTGASALAVSGKTTAALSSPTVGEFSQELAPALTGVDAQRVRLKQQWAREVVAGTAGDADPSATAAAVSRNLAEPYYQQVNEFYCGPATITMVAGYLGVGWSGSVSSKQSQAASLLGTTSAGTAWYGWDNVPYYPGTSMYPMHDAINYRLYSHHKVVWYIPTALPGSPSSAQQSDFVTNLVSDISSGYPEEDNQYSVPGYQLPYQPNGTWYHWWSARGYNNSGNTTGINDPAAWSNGVEHWVTTKGGAHTVVVALGGRGYIW